MGEKGLLEWMEYGKKRKRERKMEGSKHLVGDRSASQIDRYDMIDIQVLPSGLFRTCLQIYTVEVR